LPRTDDRKYTTVERMAILELRAMRGWNKAETARRFFVTDDTIRAWLRQADDDSLVQTRTPVNRFPDFVGYSVQQIKLFCPTLGKVKIADKLARAGIHIGKTTVGRILKEKPVDAPEPTSDDTGKQCPWGQNSQPTPKGCKLQSLMRVASNSFRPNLNTTRRHTGDTMRTTSLQGRHV
jgi:transposase